MLFTHNLYFIQPQCLSIIFVLMSRLSKYYIEIRRTKNCLIDSTHTKKVLLYTRFFMYVRVHMVAPLYFQQILHNIFSTSVLYFFKFFVKSIFFFLLHIFLTNNYLCIGKGGVYIRWGRRKGTIAMRGIILRILS